MNVAPLNSRTKELASAVPEIVGLVVSTPLGPVMVGLGGVASAAACWKPLVALSESAPSVSHETTLTEPASALLTDNPKMFALWRGNCCRPRG